MSRNLLKRVIKGGEARESRLRVIVVCNGVKTLKRDEAIDAGMDITLEIHCNSLEQLELQEKRCD